MRQQAGKKIKKVGFVVKYHQPEAAKLAQKLALFLNHKGCRLFFASDASQVAKAIQRDCPGINTSPKSKLIDLVDLIIVVGGDGTYLSIARLMKGRSVPVIGINMGQLGFLTEVKKQEAFDVLGEIIETGKMRISERSLLEVTLQRGRKTVFTGPVLNDAVISKGAIARIIGLEVKVNRQTPYEVRADGLIISTPTGSTAYSLAAGGPIVEPSLRAIVVTPICPHSLTQRSLILRSESEIQIRLAHRPGHVLLTLDGQDVVDLREEDMITVRQFKKHYLQLVSSPTRDYFSLLREKLQFGFRP